MGSASVTVMILVAFVAQTHALQQAHSVATLVGTSYDKLVDKLADRALEVWPLHTTDLQNTALGKPGHVRIGSGMKPTPGIPYNGKVVSSNHWMRFCPLQYHSSIICASQPNEALQGVSIEDLLPPDIDDPQAVQPSQQRNEPKSGVRTAALAPPEDLTDKMMLSIVLMEMSDDDVNKLVWKYLGYRYDEASGKWDASNVFPEWAEKFSRVSQPPDFVGVTPEEDEPVATLLAQEALHKMVPMEHKDNLRAFLIPLGWKGFKKEELADEIGQKRRRRAHIANWLLYYREALHGVSIEELGRRRAAAEAERKASQVPGGQPTRQRVPERKPGPRTAALPPPDDLSDKVMLSIVLMEMSDEDVNKLAWKYLGYRYDEASGKWDASNVFLGKWDVSEWAERYPQPPDLLGVTRNYTSQEIDEPIYLAVDALQKTVPVEHKDNLKAYLKPLGWRGFRLEELTPELGPNKRRRAHVANWLYFYREALHGVSKEELGQRG